MRQAAAKVISCNDPECVLLLYKGRGLFSDSQNCSQEGLKMNSELICKVVSEPLPSETSQSESKESRSPSPAPAEELVPIKEPENPEEVLRAVSDDFYKNLLPRARKLSEHLPDSKEGHQRKRELADEMLTRVVAKLDSWQSDGRVLNAKRLELLRLADAHCRDFGRL